MNKLHDLLRLLLTTELSITQITQALSVARNTATRYRRLVALKGLTWPDLEPLTGAQLDAMFNKAPGRLENRVSPDYERCSEDLEKPGVTRTLLWEEYRASSPDATLSYSQFSENLRLHRQKTKRSMRQVHAPGERGFVDYSGKRPHYIDRQTGVPVPVELFVGCLGYSNLTFAIATPSQTLPDWVSAHVEMLRYFGGSPQIMVPDNLRSAVTKSGKEPVINRTYLDVASHYSFVVMPARAYRPKDKAKVEGAVKIVQRWILARLRNQLFFSLVDLNAAISILVEQLNDRPFKRLPGSRRSRFNDLERDALTALPANAYEFAQWSALQTVAPDYHVTAQGHWYSVPHRLVGRKVEARVGNTVVEIFADGSRVALHARSQVEGGITTFAEHQPANHRGYAERTPERYQAWARHIGPYALQVVDAQLARKVPSVGFPACDSLRKTARQHGDEKFELAAKRAMAIGSPTVKSIRSILNTGLYLAGTDPTSPYPELPNHSNVRGPDYYAKDSQVC
jgi:transposase